MPMLKDLRRMLREGQQKPEASKERASWRYGMDGGVDITFDGVMWKHVQQFKIRKAMRAAKARNESPVETLAMAFMDAWSPMAKTEHWPIAKTIARSYLVATRKVHS